SLVSCTGTYVRVLLFVLALRDYFHSLPTADGFTDHRLESACQQWFGERFSKPHEACGAGLANRILEETKVPENLKKHVVALMKTKTLEASDVLMPVKLLVDSEVESARLDSTASDGL